MIAGIGILTVLIVAGILVFGSRSSTEKITAKTVDAPELVRESSQALGPADAKVTIVEFADFQCPACAASHPTLKQLITDYGDKIRFVFRHYPLAMHANAQLAARAAEAAGKQGKFWELHSLLYENQNAWAFQLKPEGKFVEYAKELGLNEEQFKADLTDVTTADKIAQDMGDGDALGVDATPTIYFNSEKLGSPSDQVLRSKIDEALR